MKRFTPVPRKAILLGVLIAVAIVLCAAKVVHDLRTETLRSAVRGNADIAVSISHDIERTLRTYDLSLQAIVTDLTTAGVMELSPAIRDRVLFDSSIKARNLGSILVIGSHGNAIIESGSPVPRRESFREREFFRFHRGHAGSGLHIGPPVKGADDVYRITLSRRMTYGDGAFGGVVVGTVELSYFQELFARIDLGAQGSISLLHDDGTLLMRRPFGETDLGRNFRGTQPFDEMREKGRGEMQARSPINGIERQYGYQRVGDLPMILSIARSTDEIYAGWRERALLIAGLTAALLLGCGTLAWILQRELRRRAAMEVELFAQRERLAVTLASIGDAVLSTDDEANVLYMNPVAERMSGWSMADAKGHPVHEVFHLTTAGRAATAINPIERALRGKAACDRSTDIVLHGRDGGEFAVEETAAPIRDRDGEVVGAVMVFHDVSEARRLANRMSYVAQHDTLTDLPNRLLFQDRLAQAIERASRNRQQTAVLFIDLDHFKHVNDSLGHRAGDQLLIEMAGRLRTCVRDVDTVCRQGGDEFVVLLSDLADGRGASRVADSILHKLSVPFEVDGHDVMITASIGVALYPDDGADVAALTRNADAAMYLAKQSGRNGCRFFTSELGDVAQKRLNAERQIAEGLARDEFVLHYQPLCRTSDGRPMGVEALVRWMRDGELVMPGHFIPIAEESGQIVELGDVILQKACRQAAAWNRDRAEPFTVAVNVSAHQFRASGFVDRVRSVLGEHRLDPRCLELEITESLLLEDVERTERILAELKTIGLSIALDDFGTGYSSLSYLSRFPVDRLKIDRSFVQAIHGNPRNRQIVQAIIRLGQDLKLKVLAEGVETVEQWQALGAMGCPELQGYLFGRPCDAADVKGALPAPASPVSDTLVEDLTVSWIL